MRFVLKLINIELNDFAAVLDLCIQFLCWTLAVLIINCCWSAYLCEMQATFYRRPTSIGRVCILRLGMHPAMVKPPLELRLLWRQKRQTFLHRMSVTTLKQLAQWSEPKAQPKRRLECVGAFVCEHVRGFYRCAN